MDVLCLNAGSSSLKFAVYRVAAGDREKAETLLAEGEVERVGAPGSRLRARAPAASAPIDREERFADHIAAVGAVFAALETLGASGPDAVGHRIVHGGARYASPARIDARVLDELRRLVVLAPLHMPSGLAVIDAVTAKFPALPQVACFDTGFHHRLPEVAQRLPLPGWLGDEGVRRYGFHGLSYEYVLATLGPAARGRLVIAHLGNGASLAAVRDARSLDTTMGLTPTGGLVMGTRTGDLDPGVLLYLLREKRYDAAALERLVDREAGLLGVSGTTSDVRALLAARDGDPRAALAIALFCYQARKHIGAMAAVLGGLDMLVFTGGIGEHAAPVRTEICAGLEHLGVRLDRDRNERGADPISTDGSACTVRVIKTNEDLMIARHVATLLKHAATDATG
jgi:acetate kinase